MSFSRLNPSSVILPLLIPVETRIGMNGRNTCLREVQGVEYAGPWHSFCKGECLIIYLSEAISVEDQKEIVDRVHEIGREERLLSQSTRFNIQFKFGGRSGDRVLWPAASRATSERGSE